MKTVDLVKNRIKEAKCAVLGFGVSNIPLVEILLKCGNEIIVHDKNDIDSLDPIAKCFQESGVRFVTGDRYLDSIEADIIFRSPGIRPDHRGIVKALEDGAEMLSEMELFLDLTPAKVLGITGSDGKTTSTTITYKLLEKEFESSKRKVYVGGNIGTPLLPYVGQMTENDICVLELSSFQLFTISKSPERSALTNISPNHLDWHKDMNEYISAKKNIYSHGSIHATFNARNEESINLYRNLKMPYSLFSADLTLTDVEQLYMHENKPKTVFFVHNGYVCEYDGASVKHLIDINKILLPGKHNIENYMTAVSLTYGLVSNATVEDVAQTFKGVEHRLEFVRELDGVKYYNSSIDSSPSRTSAALSALNVKPIVICGGYDKNIPFEPLAEALSKCAKAVVLTGQTSDKILKVLRENKVDIDIHIERNFHDAVVLAKEISKAGDIVLLSPACASFDAFKNFMERGNRFKEIVNEF